MSTRTHIAGGRWARAVYDDRWLPLWQALGTVEIERATDVEWESGQWVARLRGTGEIVAQGTDRAEVVAAEVAYLERGLSCHTR